MSKRYLEDFTVGLTFGSGRLRVDKEQIKAFAADFDAQPFHLDEDAARDTIFRGLAASGWHTAALTIGFWSKARSNLPAASLARVSMSFIGRGLRGLAMSFHIESEVLEVRSSKSRSNQGLIK